MTMIVVPSGITLGHAEAVLEQIPKSRVARDHLASSLAHAEVVPDPAEDAQAAMTETRLREIDSRLLTASDVAVTLGGSPTNKSMASRLPDLLRFKRHGLLRYPDVQFKNGSLDPTVQGLVATLRESGSDDRSITLWFYAPNGSLPDRASPAAVLESDPDAVTRLVSQVVVSDQW